MEPGNNCLGNSCGENLLLSSEAYCHKELRADDSGSDKVSSYAEYDMAEDDVIANSSTTSDGNSSPFPFVESVGDLDPEADADSAIVAMPGESGSASPESNRKTLSTSDGEERFESYGEEYATTSPTSGTTQQNRRSPQPFQRRTTWLRTSLRRSPGEKRRLTSNALASQLYRSSSFNCGRNSSSGESDEPQADFSLEEDVLDLNQKVHMLHEQVTALAHTQSSTDDKYTRCKQENAVLQAKITMLEEQVQDVEHRSDERLKEEQKRYRELMARHEREKLSEFESYNLRLNTLEKDNAEHKEENFRLRSQLEKLKLEKYACQEQLSETEFALSKLRDEQKRTEDAARRERDDASEERSTSSRVMDALSKELEELRRRNTEWERERINAIAGHEMPSRCLELEDQLKKMKEENESLRDSRDELEAQLLSAGIEEGRNLLHSGGNSLAAELEAMSKDEVKEALREQRDVNAKLRAYIDGILLNILEQYPALLEVKPPRQLQ